MRIATCIEYMKTYVCRFEVLESNRVILFTVGTPEWIANVNSVCVHKHHSLLFLSSYISTSFETAYKTSQIFLDCKILGVTCLLTFGFTCRPRKFLTLGELSPMLKTKQI